MKIGTDSILLGAWADPGDGFGKGPPSLHGAPHTVLDIGTGTGVLAVMMAQRFPAVRVTGLEIDQAAADQANENFARSPWPDRLSCVHADARTWSTCDRFDLIISNPPFFDHGLRSPNPRRRTARHTDQLATAELLSAARRVLTPTGRLCLIYPFRQRDELVEAAANHGLYPEVECRVRPSPRHDPHRVLLRFSAEEADEPECSELPIETARHHYTPQYAALARPFLLKL